MIFYNKDFEISKLRVSRILLIFVLLLTAGGLRPVSAADFEPLQEISLLSLSKHLEGMRKLAPQLRIQLRSVRMTMKFDVREIHNIERSIGKAQTIIERLLTMHKMDRVNPIRAHFLVGDLRRKASVMAQGLSHIKERMVKKYDVTEEEALQKIEIDAGDAQLISLLQDYNQLLSQSLQLVSAEPRKETRLSTE